MSYRDNNVTKYVALIFIKEFSPVLCSLLPSSWSFPAPVFLAQHECWCRSPGVRRSRLSYPIPTLTPGSGRQEATQACSRLCAASATSPNWVLSFAVGGGCSTDMEGGRTTRRGQGLGGWVGQGGEGREVPSFLRRP